MTVQLKTAEDDNTSLQQALMSEIELRMQLEGTVGVTVYLSVFDKKGMVFCIAYRAKKFV